MASVLVVDDEKHIRTHLATYLRKLGHLAEIAPSAHEALVALDHGVYDLVLSDVRMAEMDGLALLGEIRKRHPNTVVVLMTAYATVPEAVQAMRTGAYDYMVKPFSLDQVDLLLQRVLEVQDLRTENRRLRRLVGEPVWFESRSPAMQRALQVARQAASSDVTVLLTGESGTGKTVLARQIHGWSTRRNGPFVTIACTTLSEHLLESELFGHVKGAFTGAWKDNPGRLEAAEGGTVFLDEVGELPPELQAKLLRFLEERRFERVGGRATLSVDARVIAATNRDLATDVAAGRFRADLFFRLNVIGIELPSLHERASDLPALVDHLIVNLAAKHRRGSLEVTPEARQAIGAYSWPGNLRELVNALERAVVLSRGQRIEAENLPDPVLAPPSATRAAQPSSAVEAQPEESLETVERHHILQVLGESATLEEAAARLGISATTLWRRRKRYALD